MRIKITLITGDQINYWNVKSIEYIDDNIELNNNEHTEDTVEHNDNFKNSNEEIFEKVKE